LFNGQTHPPLRPPFLSWHDKYLAVPHPDKPGVYLVDTEDALTFSTEVTVSDFKQMEPVLLLNRRVPVVIEFIPQSGTAACQWQLLMSILEQVLGHLETCLQDKDLSQTERLTVRQATYTLSDLRTQLVQSLIETLIAAPARPESLYATHDVLAMTLQRRLAQLGQPAGAADEDGEFPKDWDSDEKV